MMRLKQWGAVLMGCAALLLTACTVVDLDENGKPVLPADQILMLNQVALVA